MKAVFLLLTVAPLGNYFVQMPTHTLFPYGGFGSQPVRLLVRDICFAVRELPKISITVKQQQG